MLIELFFLFLFLSKLFINPSVFFYVCVWRGGGNFQRTATIINNCNNNGRSNNICSIKVYRLGLPVSNNFNLNYYVQGTRKTILGTYILF